ncbi:hypothetical protein RHGRI_029263 [Rhododendron griersonianum]|nr:hypothetical protein RHGRI_029263 [Rhododendron griersonianum]
MKAILPWWAQDEMKVVTSRDSLEGKAMGLRLLQKVEFDLEKPLLGSIGGMLICAMGVPGTREVFPFFFFLVGFAFILCTRNERSSLLTFFTLAFWTRLDYTWREVPHPVTVFNFCCFQKDYYQTCFLFLFL